MSGLDLTQVRLCIVRPTLQALAPEIAYSLGAELLVLCTALQESGLRALRQEPTGPARGLYQDEREDHDDAWTHFLAARPALGAKVRAFAGTWIPDLFTQVSGNFYYATAICRVHYFRLPDAIPAAGDAAGAARLWKHGYNTAGGGGTEDEFATHYRSIAP